MSLNTIARWNAIPLEHPPEDEAKKRPRSSHEDEDSDDDVSLVSRSPSPRAMDVDTEDIHMYDEHRDVRGIAREVITMDTKIKSSNKGFALLARMGWVEGQPLGLSGDGRVDPLQFTVKQDSTGLGKVNQEMRMIETTVSQRRELDSERMQRETEEQRKKRETVVAHKMAVKSEISGVLKPFYCEICDKQFQNVAQYDEHTNSYGHHHRVRLRDMQANHPLRQVGKEEAERRKEKERKREEKELRKMAKAAGVKITVPSTAVAGPVSNTGGLQSNPVEVHTPLKNTGGWAKAMTEASPVPSGSRWSSVSTSSVTASHSGQSNAHPPVPAGQPPTPTRGGWRSTAQNFSMDGSHTRITDNPGVTVTTPTQTQPSSVAAHNPIPPSEPSSQFTPPSSNESQPKTEKKSKMLAKAADQSRGNWQQFQKNRGSWRK